MNARDQQQRILDEKRRMVRSDGWGILLQELEKRREEFRNSVLKLSASGPDRDVAVAGGKHAGITAAIQIMREWEDATRSEDH